METSNLSLWDIVHILRDGSREGAEKDDPEGVRWVKISDTLARLMATRIIGVLSEMGATETEED